MLFNSLDFLFFLPVVFVLYWFVFAKSKNSQNAFLLLASYTFYSFWDWRFSFLLAFSTALDYFSGLIVDQSMSLKKKKFWMRLSILINVGLLGYFKYANFFIDSFVDLLQSIGFNTDIHTLNIVLPIGISFYTFHGVSYVLDIYYGRIKAHKSILDYSLFVAYFPLLVAGPIERATHLLPQLKSIRTFKYAQAVEGCKFILWGMFKKVVVADTLAPVVNDIFGNYQSLTAVELITGLVAFAFQVYGDFSGYSDIARGVSKLFGIELILNFNFPYFSKSIPEFWSKWHISLSSWLNDYVFNPLALTFRNYGKNGLFVSVFITFLIAGLWHGSAWHFVAYGAFHGILYIPSIYNKKGIKSMLKRKQETLTISDIPQILVTFSLVCVGYLLFRSASLIDAFQYIQCLVLSIAHQPLEFFQLKHYIHNYEIIYMIPIIIGDFIFMKHNGFVSLKINFYLKSIVYIVLIIMILTYFKSERSFIYFQF